MLHELVPRSSCLRAWPASPALDAGSVVAAVAEAAARAATPFFLQDLLLPLAVVPFAPSTPALLESWHGRRVGHRDLGGAPRAGSCASHLGPAPLPPRRRGSWGAAPRSQSAAAWTRMVGRGGCMGGGGPSCLSQLRFEEKSETWKPQRKTGVGTTIPLREGRGVGGTCFPAAALAPYSFSVSSVCLARFSSQSLFFPVASAPSPSPCRESFSQGIGGWGWGVGRRLSERGCSRFVGSLGPKEQRLKGSVRASQCVC